MCRREGVMLTLVTASNQPRQGGSDPRCVPTKRVTGSKTAPLVPNSRTYTGRRERVRNDPTSQNQRTKSHHDGENGDDERADLNGSAYSRKSGDTASLRAAGGVSWRARGWKSSISRG